MGFAIIRQEKIKNSSSFNGRTSHNNRSVLTKNIDKNKIDQNINLVKNPYKNYDEFVKLKKEEIRKYNIKNGTKHRFVRKQLNKKTNEKEYSAMFQELIFTHSKDALSEKDSIAYLKAANKFVQDRFPDCEIIASDIHLDETTPHLHIIASYYNKNECRFMQKELSQAKLTDINEIRKAFQTEVADKYELKMQDGSVVKPKDHIQANKQIAELKELEAKNKQYAEDLLISQANQATQKEEHLKSLVLLKEIEIEELKITHTDALEALSVANDTLTKEKELTELNMQELTNANKTLQEQNKALSVKVVDLNKTIDSSATREQYNTLYDKNTNLINKNKKMESMLNEIFENLEAEPHNRTNESFMQNVNAAIAKLKATESVQEQNEVADDKVIEEETFVSPLNSMSLEDQQIIKDGNSNLNSTLKLK